MVFKKRSSEGIAESQTAVFDEPVLPELSDAETEAGEDAEDQVAPAVAASLFEEAYGSADPLVDGPKLEKSIEPVAVASDPAESQPVPDKPDTTKVLKMAGLLGSVHPVRPTAGYNGVGLLAPAFPQMFCPICKLPLVGFNPTSPRPEFYQHPFDASPALANKQCDLKGKKFKPPLLFLEEIPDTRKK